MSARKLVTSQGSADVLARSVAKYTGCMRNPGPSNDDYRSAIAALLEIRTRLRPRSLYWPERIRADDSQGATKRWLKHAAASGGIMEGDPRSRVLITCQVGCTAALSGRDSHHSSRTSRSRIDLEWLAASAALPSLPTLGFPGTMTSIGVLITVHVPNPQWLLGREHQIWSGVLSADIWQCLHK